MPKPSKTLRVYWLLLLLLGSIASADDDATLSRPLALPEGITGDPAKSFSPNGNEAAIIRVTAKRNSGITFSYPSSFQLKHAGAQARFRPKSNFPSNSFQMPESEAQEIRFGGTLDKLPASLPAGDYTGSFSVTVRFDKKNDKTVTVTATLSVIRGLSAKKISDLDFGVGVQGDPSLSIDPANGSGHAGMDVAGQPNRTVTITLPGNNLKMRNGRGGSADKEIPLSNFRTNLAGSTFQLDGNGNGKLWIGATRAALRPNQYPGSYSTTFTVTIAY